jgi:cell division protein FtsW
VAKKLASDTTLFAITLGLLGFGLIAVWSASSFLAQELHGNPYHFLLRQAVWAFLGVGVMVAAMRLDYRNLRRPGLVYSVVIVATLLLVLVLFLKPVNDVHRWIRVGELSFQPAELAKLAVILFLAYHLERRGERVNEFLTSIFPVVILVGWFGFLIFIQPDLGTAAALGLIACVMLFLAGVRARYFAMLLLALPPLAFQAIVSAPYRVNRLSAYLNPWADARGSGYHIIQSYIAVGTGGLTGAGLMEGRQKLFYLPYPYSDFIYAVIGEELGLLGAAALVVAFVLFLWRGLRAAWRAPDPFGTYLAAGLTLAVVLQAFINVSVVLGLLPTKGIPLPFISAGGTSLLFTLLSVGIVLNVSQHGD